MTWKKMETEHWVRNNNTETSKTSNMYKIASKLSLDERGNLVLQYNNIVSKNNICVLYPYIGWWL